MTDLSGKNIIVIGGTSGIGLACAKALQRNGARVVAVGRNDQWLATATEELGSDSMVFAGDALEEDTITRAIEMFTSLSLQVHGLFHVAGGSGRSFGDGPLHELTRAGWDQTLALNLTSVMISNQAMVKYFMDHKIKGTILNVSSVLGYSPSPKYFVTHSYATAKAAIIGFSTSIAAYYASFNIRVNVVAPSLMVTPMSARATQDDKILSFIKTKQPLDGGRPGYSEDIVGAVCYFMSDASSFVTGQVLSIDGGWHLSEGQYEAQDNEK